MPDRYTFGRISDSKVVSLANALLDAFVGGTVILTIGGNDAVTLEKSKEEGETQTGWSDYAGLLKEDTYLISHMSFSTGTRYKVDYWRSRSVIQAPGGGDIWGPAPNPYIDGIEVRVAEDHAPLILEIVTKHISMAPPIAAGPEAGKAMDQSAEILNRLSSSITTLVEHTAERQKELDATRQSLSKESEKRIKEKKLEIEQDNQKIIDDFNARAEKLNERENSLDDRANTHARRAFAQHMAGLSDTRLSENLLSKSVISFILPIVISIVAIIALGILIAIEATHIGDFSANVDKIITSDLISDKNKVPLTNSIYNQILFSQIRMGVQAIGAAALIWFCLRLSSARYKLVSDWERHLHKFRLDTERAGFLVEGDLEARKVNDAGLPEILLQSFSRNLFGANADEGDHNEQSLGGTLNTLLGQAARVRVGPDGVSVEVEGKGIKRAKKLLDEET